MTDRWQIGLLVMLVLAFCVAGSSVAAHHHQADAVPPGCELLIGDEPDVLHPACHVSVAAPAPPCLSRPPSRPFTALVLQAAIFQPPEPA
jgi:hypothetical protein